MSHYKPKPSPIVKRFEFNSRCQREGESIATYVAELRKIAEHCQFGVVLNDMLLDRLVCGMIHKGIQRRLLVEPSLTFDKATETALAAEAADKDSIRLTGAAAKDKDHSTPDNAPPAPLIPVHKVDQRPQRSNHNKSPPAAAGGGDKKSCYRCGGGHLASECPCREYVCHSCKKKGHLSKMCRKKGKGSKPKEEAKVLVDKDANVMDHVESGSRKPYRTVVNINGTSLSMEIDMGASVLVIGKQIFETLQKGVSTLELQSTAVNLRTYTGESIAVLGSVLVPVEYSGQTLNLSLIVT